MNNSLKIGLLALSLLTVTNLGFATTHQTDKHIKPVNTHKADHKKSTAKKKHKHKHKHKAIDDAESNMFGIASWYGYESGPRYRRRPKTANGEYFSPNEFTAAHKSLPFGTVVEVTNLKNNKSVLVRINDRGPFLKGRVIDLSKAAAMSIGVQGVEKVSLTIKGIYTKYTKYKEKLITT